MATAAVTGNPPKMGEHKEMQVAPATGSSS
jgi:hypothetical protein